MKLVSTLPRLIVAGGLAGSMAWAAPITWTVDATTVTTVNDIDLTGVLVHAGTWGSAAQSVTVGTETIDFAARTINETGNPADVTANGATSQAGFFTGDTGDAGFDSVLDSFAYDGVNPKIVTISGLTSGVRYQIQLFASDDRGASGGRTQKWSDNATDAAGNETAVFAHNTSPYVIGTFTADATSQIVYGRGVAQGQTIVNGYVLRELTPLTDDDNDGLPDAWEQQIIDFDPGDGVTGLEHVMGTGAAPAVTDFDGDNLNDGIEFSGGTNPTTVDTDGDTLNDGVEDANLNGVVDPTETDPKEADTDGDGLLDSVETNNGIGSYLSPTDTGTDPLEPDTDGDTILDGDEVDTSVGSAFFSDPTLDDTDGDGMFDDQEVDNGLDPNDATGDNGAGGDPDLDTVLNSDELANGTDPLNDDTDGDLLLDGVETNNGFGSYLSPTDTGTDPLASDTDGDTILDGDEIDTSIGSAFFSDPTLEDTDNDSLFDNEEVDNGLDPNDPTGDNGAAGDPDGDGISNQDEILGWGPTSTFVTNPQDDDSDGDTLLDSVETGTGNFIGASDTGTDPTKPDTDGDGLLDAVETNTGTFANATDTGTDPSDPDSDGDGFSDGLEVDAGTDPNDPNDMPGLDAGLVGYWPLDGNASDFSGTGADGTFKGTAAETFATGQFGQAASLDGVDQYYEIEDSSETFDFGAGNGFGGTGNVTVSAWFQTGPFTGNWQALVAKGESANWRVARYNGTNQIGYASGTGDIGDDGPDVNTSPGPGDSIHHVVAITDGAVGTTIYVDGVLADSSTVMTLGGLNGFNMTIGNNPERLDRSWLGLIDDVAIWNRVLSEDEVFEIYDGGIAGDSLGDLTGIDTSQPTAPTVDSFDYNQTTGEVTLVLSGLDATKDYQMKRSILLDGTDWVDVAGATSTGSTSATYVDPDPPTGPSAEAYYSVFDVTP